MNSLPIGLLVDLFLIFGALLAFWKGSAAERTAAAVVLLNVLIGRSVTLLALDERELIWLCNDGLTALVLLFVTVRFAAPWMGGVMLFFAAQFALHAYYIVTLLRPFDYTYAVINNLNWAAITWCLIFGTIAAWRRRLRVRKASL